MNEKKQIAINVISTLISFAVTFGINFFLSPYIINNVGSEAYGFVSLGNQFVNYIQIITLALNSMAARFITLKLYENKETEAKIYFSSVFFSNIILAFLVAGPLTILVLFIQEFLNVPLEILLDVKILWALIFITFIITLLVNVFSIATYAKNRIELASLRNIESNIIKGLLLIILYLLFKPSIVYVGIGALIAAIYVAIRNIYYTHVLLPEMTIKRKFFRLSAVKELISSGIWNSLTHLSSILISGLDLLVANIFVGATGMGILSIAKTVPMAINQLIGTIPGAFAPQFIIDYAEKKYDKLLDDINFAIKVITIISCVPLVGIVVFGKAFYSLWIPSQNIEIIYMLSLATCAVLFITSPIRPLYTIFSVTNKVKYDSITVFIQGIVSILVTLVLLSFQRDDIAKIFIIAIVSSIMGILRNFIFTPIYAAHCLKLKYTIFYKKLVNSLFAFFIAFVVEFIISYYIPSSTWLTLFISASLASLAGILCNILIILSGDERHLLLHRIKLLVRK